ncbi:hypothetical protein GIB67_016500 [Kingdonia uniflora]|uniref:Uncharacterized protein n=1 Tax=Kingdonia uniflora TaxID=39325 RepID=A0A7J7M848_9MAGN|nr:hypothetical protein GIB67_016500 [Kingdonia uniflora]
MINSSSSSPIKRFTTSKNLENTQREKRKIRGFDKELSESDKRLKRVKDFGSRRWLYSSVVGGKLDATADSHSDIDGMKSKVERKESLLDEVVEEETELKLVLEGLGLIALKYQKKWMLKALPASGTTGSGEVTKDKRRRVEPSGESGEKVIEGRSATVDDLKEVEERSRLAVLQGEEDTSKMVARLVKGIWFGIEEEKSDLKKTNAELEKELARSRDDALKKVSPLKASHAMAIGPLQVETKANLEEMVEEHDRLGHHLMLKGYSEEEVDAIKADTYVEEEDVEETEAAVRKMSLRISDLESRLFREKETSKALLFMQMELQVKEKDSEIKKGLKELAEVTERAEKLQSRVDALAAKGKKADTAQYRI